ncbi:MAG: OmpA family protein [Pseudomonadota bacterium]|nr:OmpA family protein [Pseudomonadota bacterium]
MKAKIFVLLGVLVALSGCAQRRDVDLEFQRFADVQYSVDGAKLIINSNLIFDTDRKKLRPEAVKILRSLYRQVSEEYFTKVHISAHCDNSITERSAAEITDYQAQVVAGYFWFRGISSSEIELEGAGFSFPVAEMDTPQGVFINQRIEILLT